MRDTVGEATPYVYGELPRLRYLSLTSQGYNFIMNIKDRSYLGRDDLSEVVETQEDYLEPCFKY